MFDAQGDIVTNAHVVAGAKKIQVTSSGGGSPANASMVGAFAADDLAVIKVGGVSLKPASWGESGKAQVGQIVLAMGNPLGLSGSVTNGIVSALHRTVSTKGRGPSRGRRSPTPSRRARTSTRATAAAPWSRWTGR
ncbi:S1C family serine protease [Actinomadura luteofluorescens]|uniref:S1C family serine protease n=1 Tax=Actinomadura luteofluorescens TaxID=46163 RepID=UPI00363FD167